MFTLKDKAGIATSIAAIAVAGTALGTEAHQTLVSILAHIRDHGDTSQLTAFVKALPSMARRNAVGPYVQHFSGKQLNVVLKDGEWNSKLVGKRDNDLFDIEGAMEISFADFTKEPKVKDQPLTLADLVKMLKRVTGNDKTLKDGVTPMVPDYVVAAAQRAIAVIEQPA